MADDPPVRPLDPPLPPWAFEYVANPLVSRLLGSRFHGLASDSLLLVTVTGRRSGREYTTPVGYVEHDGAIWLSSNVGNDWWRNCRDAPVVLTLRGEDRSGHAEVVEDDAAVADFLEEYVAAHGIEATDGLAVTIDGESLPDRETLIDCVADVVLVRVELAE